MGTGQTLAMKWGTGYVKLFNIGKSDTTRDTKEFKLRIFYVL